MKEMHLGQKRDLKGAVELRVQLPGVRSRHLNPLFGVPELGTSFFTMRISDYGQAQMWQPASIDV
jgi:hypothetical protein